MDQDRAAAKRRASFARADRLRKETLQKAEQARTEQSRKAAREKADRDRKTNAAMAAELRNAEARKRAEQRRLDRRAEKLKKEFARKTEDRRSQNARADQQKTEAAKNADQKQRPEPDLNRRQAELFTAVQEKRQRRDQRSEHHRQTDRLRTEHRAQHEGARHREAAAIIQHARHIRNIDIAERRELEALDAKRQSLGGRAVGLVRGSEHYARQEREIVERHENERWRKHREHEARKDALFWTGQAERLRRVSERATMAKTHQTETQELRETQRRTRPQRVEGHIKALERLRSIPVQRSITQDNARPTAAFGHAAGRSLEIKR